MQNAKSIGRPKGTFKEKGEPITPERSYNFHQLRAALGCSAVTLWRRINEEGLGQFGAKVGGDWLFTGKSVLEWIESKTQRAQQQAT